MGISVLLGIICSLSMSVLGIRQYMCHVIQKLHLEFKKYEMALFKYICYLAMLES